MGKLAYILPILNRLTVKHQKSSQCSFYIKAYHFIFLPKLTASCRFGYLDHIRGAFSADFEINSYYSGCPVQGSKFTVSELACRKNRMNS